MTVMITMQPCSVCGGPTESRVMIVRQTTAGTVVPLEVRWCKACNPVRIEDCHDCGVCDACVERSEAHFLASVDTPATNESSLTRNQTSEELGEVSLEARTLYLRLCAVAKQRDEARAIIDRYEAAEDRRTDQIAPALHARAKAEGDVERMEAAVRAFLAANPKPTGAKADRDDYITSVSCGSLYRLHEAFAPRAAKRRTCRTPYPGGTCGCGCGCDENTGRPEAGTCDCSECVPGNVVEGGDA